MGNYDDWKADRTAIDAAEARHELGFDAAREAYYDWCASHYDEVLALWTNAFADMRAAYEAAAGQDYGLGAGDMPETVLADLLAECEDQKNYSKRRIDGSNTR